MDQGDNVLSVEQFVAIDSKEYNINKSANNTISDGKKITVNKNVGCVLNDLEILTI